jgi:aminoglycoside phosphotransferase (APT) family kinase protein
MTSSPAPRPQGIDQPRVDAWLAAHVPKVMPPFAYEPIAGGGSNLTFRVTDADGHQWALRRPPTGPILATAHDMAREVRIITALASSPVPVPTCEGFCQDPAVTGAPFYVMTFVDGHVIRDLESTTGMSEADADVATDSLVDTQIALHTLDLDAHGLGDLARHGDYIGRQLARWRRQVEQSPVRDLPLVFDLHDRLVRHKPEESVAPGLAHGDYRFDNVVLDSRFAMAAVLDWELCTIGDPIADFVWSLEYWSNSDDPVSFLSDPPTASNVFVDRDEVVDRYRSRCGFEVGDLSYYRVFSWWKQACIVEGALARQLESARRGETNKDPADTARHADDLLEHACELATGVL